MFDTSSQITIRQDLRFTVVHPESIKTEISLDSQGTIVQGEINDISIRGMRIFVDSKIPNGTDIRIAFHSDALNIKGMHEATVRWSQPRDNSSWWIGCELVEPFPRELLSDLAATGILERRQDDRHSTNLSALANWQLNTVPSAVVVKNYSIGGCCLEIKAPGTELSDRLLLVIDNPESDSARIPMRVMWSHPTDGAVLVGCSFLCRDGYLRLRDLIQAATETVPKTSMVATRWRLIAIAASILLFLQTINMINQRVLLSDSFLHGLSRLTSSFFSNEVPAETPAAEEPKSVDDLRPVSTELPSFLLREFEFDGEPGLNGHDFLLKPDPLDRLDFLIESDDDVVY